MWDMKDMAEAAADLITGAADLAAEDMITEAADPVVAAEDMMAADPAAATNNGIRNKGE